MENGQDPISKLFEPPFVPHARLSFKERLAEFGPTVSEKMSLINVEGYVMLDGR